MQMLKPLVVMCWAAGLAGGGCSPVYAPTPLLDAGSGPLDCAATLPGSSEPTGAALDPWLFGCFGACGPSCRAECVSQRVERHQRATLEDGGVACVQCAYTLLTCKSHAACRWHDDCYRQCDARFAEEESGEPAYIPLNRCYSACDGPARDTGGLCSADWTQIGDSTPALSDRCWDGSVILFTRLDAPAAVQPGECPTEPPALPALSFSDGTARAQQGQVVTLPEGPTRGSSCLLDADCPDRNQVCTLRAFPPGAVCADRPRGAERNVDVTPLVPPGLHTPDNPRQTGLACVVDGQCASRRCAGGVCRAR